jgi:hypothetical protein
LRAGFRGEGLAWGLKKAFPGVHPGLAAKAAIEKGERYRSAEALRHPKPDVIRPKPVTLSSLSAAC